MYTFIALAILHCRDKAGLSDYDTEEFGDSNNHGKVYEDEIIWRIVKIASRILGMINSYGRRQLFTLP